ncbi:MAG: ABC transporter permease [Pirellulaceae bacterium]
MLQNKLTQSISQYAGLAGVLLLLVGVFSALSENFFQMSTLITIANQIPDLTFLAIGMTLVLIVGGIDLSVGSLLALSGAVLGVLMKSHEFSIVLALPFALLVATACGLINGGISIGLGIPSFIVTLGMLEIARGTTKVVTKSQSVYIGSDIEWFGQPLGAAMLSPAFITAIVAVIIGQFVLTRTVFGRYCIAIGTNAEAVRMSGIRCASYSISVFGISGLMCGLAALAQTSRMSTADPNAAVGIELAAIAACVIGGTSLMGGRGSVISSFIGVLIIQVLQTGLAQLGVSDEYKQIITGAVIIIAVLIDAVRHRWSRGV